jgi:hypothetical protein
MSRRLQQNPGNSGGDTFFIGNGLFLRFWVSAFNSLSVFNTIWQLFYLKNKTRRCLQTALQHWRWLNRIAVRHYLLAFSCCDCHCRLCGRLFAYGSHQHVPPHPPEAKPPPSYHLGSSRRPEKLHCTELLHTL